MNLQHQCECSFQSTIIKMTNFFYVNYMEKIIFRFIAREIRSKIVVYRARALARLYN